MNEEAEKDPNERSINAAVRLYKFDKARIKEKKRKKSAVEMCT